MGSSASAQIQQVQQTTPAQVPVITRTQESKDNVHSAGNTQVLRRGKKIKSTKILGADREKIATKNYDQGLQEESFGGKVKNYQGSNSMVMQESLMESNPKKKAALNQDYDVTNYQSAGKNQIGPSENYVAQRKEKKGRVSRM